MPNTLCMICGAEATTYFGANTNLPLCANPVCEQVLIDEINQELAEAASSADKEEQ